MKRKIIWLLLFVIAIIYVSFRANDFEVFLNKNLDNFTKEVSKITNSEDIVKIEQKYKKLVSDYILEKKIKDKDYKYEQYKLNSFFRNIHKNAYAQKDKIRQKLCKQVYRQVKEFTINSNMTNISPLYIKGKILSEKNCAKFNAVNEEIHNKVDNAFKKIKKSYSSQLTKVETIDELHQIENKYKNLFDRIIQLEISFKTVSLSKEYYNEFENLIQQKKSEIQKRMCSTVLHEVNTTASTLYLILKKLDIDNIKNTSFQFQQFSHALVENNCTNEQSKKFSKIKDRVFKKLHEQTILIFINSLDIQPLSSRYKKVLYNRKQTLNDDANKIAREYGHQMVGLHPIIRCKKLGDRDKEIADTYLIKPFKNLTKNYTLNTGKQINIATLNFIKKFYENFLNFCEGNELSCQVENENFSFITPYQVIEFTSELTNDYKEEGILWNTLDEALSWVPILGDAKEFLGVNVCKDEEGNIYEANKDLTKKINDITRTVEKNVRIYQDDLMKDLYHKLVSYVMLEKGGNI